MLGDWKRIPGGLRIAELVWTVAVGFLLGWATNSVALSGGIAAITRKLAFGDWDEGYAWTLYDLAFWALSFVEGALGALWARSMGLHETIRQEALREIEYVDRFHPVATRVPGENEGSYQWFVSNESPRTGGLGGQ